MIGTTNTDRRGKSYVVEHAGKAHGPSRHRRQQVSVGAGSAAELGDDHGDWHASAQRNLFNRPLGQLYHCLY